MKAKYPEIAAVIEQRLRAGDFILGGLPGERKLAEELGVSHMTARRAMQDLIARGVLPRRSVADNHDVHRRPGKREQLSIALITSAYTSNSFLNWNYALEKIVAADGGIVRMVPYVSAHDSSITDALNGKFDGIFIMPPMNMPQILVDRLARVASKTVMLFHDLTQYGIPCIYPGSDDEAEPLVEHLASLGHTRIDTINTQPIGPNMIRRFKSISAALAAHNMSGKLYNEPVEPFSHADEASSKLFGHLVDSGEFKATALICSTLGVSVGVYHAAYQRGIRIGKDLSVCSFDDPRGSRMMAPPLTTLDRPEPAELLKIGLEWIKSEGKNWNRPLEIQPEFMPVLVGQSTGPCLKQG